MNKPLVDRIAADLTAAGATVTTGSDGTPTIHIPVEGLKSLPETKAKNGNADDRLRLLIERIERLEEEKKGIGDDIKDVYNEAKATGYDAKIMRVVVSIRKMKPDDRREHDAVLELYKSSLGID